MKNDILIIAGLLTGLAGICLLCYILWRIFNRTVKSDPVNTPYLVFGFLVAAWYYPAGLHGLVKLIQTFFRQIFYLASSGTTETPDPAKTDMVVGSVFDSRVWFDSTVFVAGFVLLAIVASRLVGYLNSEPAGDEHAGSPAQRVTFKNVVVSLVLIVALYFSISSIIAVPVVSFKSEDTALMYPDLKEELDSYSEKDTFLKLDYQEFIDKKFRNIEMDTTLKTPSPLLDHFSNFRGDINGAFREIDLLKKRALARIKITDNSNITLKLKQKDKNELAAWYLENRSRFLGYLNTQQKLIGIYLNNMLEGKTEGAVLYSFEQLSAGISDAIRPQITPIPQRPTLGSDLGVFTYFTGWLLSVESYPLVIIIGLIGFGLLGAGGSTFIREQKRNEENKALIDDLAGVLIKGFSAAIVVFLGVQGSLAVLTTNNNDLNAYALFFICFVAAVFSDDAWNWAKKRFGDDFPTNGNTGDQEKA